jgi:PAS domain S-box-containing protein
MNVNHQNENIMDVASRLNAIIQTAVDGIVTISDKGIIESVNPATCKIFGYEYSEIVGQNITLLMPPPHSHSHDGYIDNYLETGHRKIIGIGREVLGKKKDGTIFPFWLAVSEVKLGEKRLFTGIVHDMTEQKKAEAELLKLNQELEGRIAERTEKLSDVVNKLLSTNQQLYHEIQERKAAEQSLLLLQVELQQALKKEQDLGLLKTRFVSMASHEFRTPLSTILSSASLMDQYTQTEQQDKRHRHFLKIKNSVEMLTMLLNDFLSISRLEEGKVELNLEKFNFNHFCAEIIDEMNGLLKKGQSIVTKHETDNLVVEMDKKLMKLILINLISNASKYSDDTKMIYCETKIIGKLFSLSIIDEGMGIPEEDKKHMFDRFFRASNAMNIKGTGLGLHIVRRYTEMMNGELSFSSELGKGSTFTVKFVIM